MTRIVVFTTDDEVEAWRNALALRHAGDLTADVREVRGTVPPIRTRALWAVVRYEATT